MPETLTQTGDIKFYFDGTQADKLEFANIKISGYDLYRDPGFETAVLISLFSNQRATLEDKLPNRTDTRGGYWGDELLELPLGSKLWLLGRSKIDNDTLTTSEQYIKDALKWMVTDGIADSIEATATRANVNQINWLVNIKKKTGDSVFFKFFVNWKFQTTGGLE